MRLFIRNSVYGFTNQNHFSGTATLYMFGDDDIEEKPVSIDGEELIEIEIRPKLSKPEIIKMYEAEKGVTIYPREMTKIFVSVHYSGELPNGWLNDDRMAMYFLNNSCKKIEIQSLDKKRNITLELDSTLENSVQRFHGYDGSQVIWITHMPGTLQIGFIYGGINSHEKRFGTIDGVCDQLELEYE